MIVSYSINVVDTNRILYCYTTACIRYTLEQYAYSYITMLLPINR